MKKYIVLLFLTAFILTNAKSQESEDYDINSEKYSVTLGINGGYAQNINAYSFGEDDKGFTYYEINPLYSFGMDAAFFATERIRPRIEYRYLEYQYGMNWPTKYASTYNKTAVRLNTCNLNLHVDYAFISREHLQVFISPGLIYEWIASVDYKTGLIDVDDRDYSYSKYNIFSKQYYSTILGGNVAMSIKYKINSYIGIVIAPNYTCYFLEYQQDENDKPYQRYGINFGTEISFDF